MTRPRRSIPKIKYCAPASESEAEADESDVDDMFKMKSCSVATKGRSRNIRDLKDSEVSENQRPRKKVSKKKDQILSAASTNRKEEGPDIDLKTATTNLNKYQSEEDSVAFGKEGSVLDTDASHLKPKSLDFEQYTKDQSFSPLQSEEEDDDHPVVTPVNNLFHKF